ncbi:MAG: hypothetical protein GTO18_08185, partial [Anaerolineales bacterium]|nr:hypothetical protein [Anaerolineales bacterium]
MKKLIRISAYGLVGCVMFLIGYFGGLTKNQQVWTFLGLSTLVFLLPFGIAVIFAIGDQEFPGKFMESWKKRNQVNRFHDASTSEILDGIMLRDQRANRGYSQMAEEDSLVRFRQSHIDRHFLLRLVSELIDALTHSHTSPINS